MSQTEAAKRLGSSPRMWRCFPTGGRKECQNVGLLHACGGVSVEKSVIDGMNGSSPRMWRCFRRSGDGAQSCRVFSTHVEVFPKMACVSLKRPVVFSTHVEVFLRTWRRSTSRLRSSPRMWRCFLDGHRLKLHERVFSTHVEVFLTGMDKVDALTLVFSTHVEVFLAVTASTSA